MFNQRKHRRRTDATSRGQRSPRFRRLAIETMESRLLLTGNQLTGGDLDDGIYNLESLGNPYVIISQDETPSVTATNNNSNPRSHQFAGSSGAEYLSIYEQFDITPSLDAPLVLRNNPPVVITTILGNGNAHGALELGGTEIVANLGSSLGANDIAYFQSDSTHDSTLDTSSILLEFRSKLGTKLDSLDAGMSAYGSGVAISLIGSPLSAPLPTAPIVKLIVVRSVDSAGFGNHVTAEFAAVAPPVDSNTVDSHTVDTNVAASSVEPPLESNVDNHVDVVAPVREVAVILPARQPSKEERLADAIDDLLSDDTIIAFPSGQSGSNFVTDSSTDAATSDLASNGQPASGIGEASVEQVADGGMIPLDAIVAVTTNNSISIASRDSQLALDETSDVVGELSRVAVMELIEGEAEPGAPQAADRAILVAAGDTTDRLEVLQAMTRRAGVAIAMAAPASPAYLAKIAGAAVDAASRAMATLVGSNLAVVAKAEVAPADDARSEAFSQLGADEDDELAAADAGSVHWNHWLAAAPLVVALACERAIASKKNRRERDSRRPPLKAK